MTVTSTDAEGTSEPSSPVETPSVQSMTVKGSLRGCDGRAAPGEEASYVAHLTTTEEVTCSTLQSISAEPTTASVSLTVKWLPKGSGTSHGTLVLPLTEIGSSLHGTLEGGPFAAPQSLFAASLSESFTGGPACGVPPAKGNAKPVKSGAFATSPVEIGA